MAVDYSRGQVPVAQGMMMRYRRWGCAAIAILILGVEMLIIAAPWLDKWETAVWMAGHLSDGVQMAVDVPDQEIAGVITDNLFGQHTFGPGPRTWVWNFDGSDKPQVPADLLAAGIGYLVIDQRRFMNADFSKRVQSLVDQGATLLYESPDPLHLGLRKAVLWTFQPDHPLNVIVGGSLLLIGYNVIRHPDGGITLLLGWDTLQTPTTAYHVYLHYLDATGAELSVQDDAELGNGTPHTSDHWATNERVLETIEIGQDKLAKLSKPYHVRLGFYQLETGKRAIITDDAQHTLGDHINLDLP